MMKVLSPVECTIQTAIHFKKGDDPDTAHKIEEKGIKGGLDTGAFLVARWEKPSQYR
jgi:hypothetical protein